MKTDGSSVNTSYRSDITSKGVEALNGLKQEWDWENNYVDT